MTEPDCPGTEAVRRGGVLIVEQGGRGGVADYTGQLAAGLAARGVPVTIATADDHLYKPAPGVRVVSVFRYVRGHSPAARFVRRAGLGPLANGLRFLDSLPRLTVLARRYPVTHIQGFERPSLGLAAMLALRLAGARLVYTAHNTFERSRGALDRARLLPALARQTIVHTEADRRRVSRPPTVIPHGHYGALADAAPATDPATARAGLGIGAEARVVLLFGVLRPDKGLNDLLDAIVDAPAWHALIAGEDHGGLAAAAKRLASPRLSGRVTVVEGFQPIDAVGRLFAAADVVALPYRQASQSGVLHLSYGFGKPVVAYPVGGLTEAVVPGVTGWVASEPSPPALASALREIGSLDREKLFGLGLGLRRWAEQSFGWDEIARATEAVYARAVCASSRG
jgi:glycosyltransferase involved in cell wall biosynthesis